MRPQQPYHLGLSALDGRVRSSLLTPIEPGAPIGLMALGSLGPEVLVKAEAGWIDLVDGHTFREGWELERGALDLRHAGTALAVAAEVARLRGPKAPESMGATTAALRIACGPAEERARWAAHLVQLALRELAPVPAPPVDL